MPPNENPMVTGNHGAVLFCSTDRLSAGKRREKKLAATLHLPQIQAYHPEPFYLLLLLEILMMLLL